MMTHSVPRLFCMLLLATLVWQRVDSQPESLRPPTEPQGAEAKVVASWPYAGQAVYPAGRYLVRPDNQGRLDFDPFLASRLQRAIDSVRVVFGIPGISAACVIPGQGTWLGVTGLSTFSPPDSIRPDMLFCIASNTKAFISTIMLKLQEEGKLSLDDSIGRYLPPYPNISGRITIRQLLRMTSGLFDYINDGEAAWSAMLANPNRLWTPEQIISTFVGPPHQEPGISFSYCNTNALLAGMIISAVEKTSISEQLHQRIFEPLLLQETCFPPEDSLAGPVAHPWQFGTDQWGDLSYSDQWGSYGKARLSLAGSAGGIFSTAENTARWANALYSGQCLTPASLTELLTFGPSDNSSRPLVKWLGYGLFVGQISLVGKPLWGHSGGYTGFISWVTYYPPAGVSVVVLLNTNSDAHALGMDAALLALYREFFRTAPSAPPGPPRTLYAVSGANESGQLHVLDRTTGAATVVGPTQYGTITGIAAHPVSGRLYGVSAACGSEIVEIDVSTGEALPRVSLFSHALARGMAFTREGDAIVSLIDYRLYRVCVNTGEAQLLSTASIGCYNLAVNPINGELWATGWDYPYNLLYKVDPVTGDATLKGSTGFDMATTSLTFDHAGNLFGLISNGVDPDNLIKIDTATGAGTLVGSLGVSKVYAIGFSPDPFASEVREIVSALPTRFALQQNFPNPFNPKTVVSSQLPVASNVELAVYDVLGREVAVLVNERRAPGSYQDTFDASSLASGVYIYRLTAGSFVQSRTMILLK